MIRGEIWWADFGIPFGSETGFERPVLIIQDDTFNQSRINTIIILPITSNLMLENAPGNVFLESTISGLPKDSIVIISQINAIDKKRIKRKIGKLNTIYLNEIEEGISLVLGLRIYR